MARPRLGAPFDVTLPSGARRTFTTKIVRPLPKDLGEAIERGAVDADRTMPLCDANVLEGILAAIAAIEAPPVPITCRNCAEEVEVEPARAVPIAPLLDPPGDPELDPEMNRDAWHDVPSFPVARRGLANRILLTTRTLEDRDELQSRLSPLRIDAQLIRALGLTALADGDTILTKSPIAIARALEALDDDTFDDAWEAIGRAYDVQHWTPRLLIPVACPKCAARNDVEALPRVFDWSPPRAEASDEVFPDLDAFTTLAASITREIMGQRRYEGLEVLVHDDVPPCDDGGEPLLGSYTPEISGVVQSSPFVIALYYRTFRSMFDDEPYDVAAEIRETIEHELEHHQYFLDGHDPMDEEERRAIFAERRRIVGGSNATELAAGAGWLASDFGRFLRVSWPLWLILLFGLVLLLAADR